MKRKWAIFQFHRILVKAFVFIFFFSGFSCFGESVFNVCSFGAKGDGKTLNTVAFQKAIDTCSQKGGGKVLVPAGTYLIGCVELRDHVNLHLAKDSILLGSPDPKDYSIKTPAFKSRTSGLYVNKSLIYAEGVKNAALTGLGTINGNGDAPAFRKVRPQNNRPYLARFVACENLLLKEVSMINSANWTCHLLGCDGVKVLNVKMQAKVRANRDGLDIDSCRNVLVQKCVIATPDDGIVLKSTSDQPCSNILIEECDVSSHASAIKMGTESNGGYQNVTIRNCKIHDVGISGLAMMVVDGGVMTNLHISNIQMTRVTVPIFVRLGKRSRPVCPGDPVPGVGTAQDIHFSNITITDASYPCSITGLHEKRIENISFKNISIQFKSTPKGRPYLYNKVPFMEQKYPGGKLYGARIPAAGFYIRNVNDLKMEHISIQWGQPCNRIPFVLDRVKNAQISNISIKNSAELNSIFYLRNTSNIQIETIKSSPAKLWVLSEKELNLKKIPANKQRIVEPLPDKTYENIRFLSQQKFEGKTYRGLACTTPAKTTTFSLKTKINRPCKLFFLTASPNKKGKLNLLINGKKETLTVASSDWGWSTVHLLKPVQTHLITIKIMSNPTSNIYIAKAGLVSLNLTD